jgi:hypothetical protein
MIKFDPDTAVSELLVVCRRAISVLVIGNWTASRLRRDIAFLRAAWPLAEYFATGRRKIDTAPLSTGWNALERTERHRSSQSAREQSMAISRRKLSLAAGAGALAAAIDAGDIRTVASAA